MTSKRAGYNTTGKGPHAYVQCVTFSSVERSSPWNDIHNDANDALSNSMLMMLLQ
jgi:hypothetical protein